MRKTLFGLAVLAVLTLSTIGSAANDASCCTGSCCGKPVCCTK